MAKVGGECPRITVAAVVASTSLIRDATVAGASLERIRTHGMFIAMRQRLIVRYVFFFALLVGMLHKFIRQRKWGEKQRVHSVVCMEEYVPQIGEDRRGLIGLALVRCV